MEVRGGVNGRTVNDRGTKRTTLDCTSKAEADANWWQNESGFMEESALRRCLWQVVPSWNPYNTAFPASLFENL